MRSNQEDNNTFNQHFQSGRFSHSRKTLVADLLITKNGPIVNFLNGGVSDRNAFLPVLEEGRFYVVGNIGTTNSIVVRDSGGFLLTTLLPADTALLFASNNEWMALRGWASLGVFTNLINGLVPAPHSGVPGSLFLRDDGQWGQVQVTGIVDAFKFITDGTNTATGAGPDTFRLRSSTNKIGITVTNNEAVFGDNANFTVLEGAVDHNALLNYVADQHVAHSGVTLTAGLGISGGGTIAASRTFDFAPSELTTTAAPVLTDFAIMDLAAAGPRRTLWSAVNAILDHNALLNFVANKHIDHSGVSIVAGSGLTGGGDITTSRTLSLDINGLTADTLATGDFFPFFDISGVDNNKVTLANLTASIDHNSLLNYVADQHIAHSGVSITGTGMLSGGGAITASRTLDLVAAAAFRILGNATGSSAVPTAIDIHALTLKGTPAGTDEVLISDQAASGALKRAALSSLAAAGGNLLAANNLSDVANITTSRSNLSAAPFDALAYNGMQTNGSMELSQERGTASLAMTTGSFSSYVLDTWLAAKNGTMVGAAQQVSDAPDGYSNSLKFTISTALASLASGDYFLMQEAIEGYRTSKLMMGVATAKSFTIGFWCKTHRTGLYSGSVRNSAQNRSYVFSWTQSVADTWEYKTITIPGDTSGTWIGNTSGVGMYLAWSMATGSALTTAAGVWTAGSFVAATGAVNGVAATTDTFQVTGVIVLPGIEVPASDRAPFIMRPFDQELTICQRYWETSYPAGVTPGTVNTTNQTAFLFQGPTGIIQAGGGVFFKVRKRAAPTVVLYSPATGASGKVRDAYNGADVTPTQSGLGDIGFNYTYTQTSANGFQAQAHWTADAR